MVDVFADWKQTLVLMSEAFQLGDNSRGEELLGTALEVGAPWDVATATVAQALSARRGLPTDPEPATA
jgi:hypothetical protein